MSASSARLKGLSWGAEDLSGVIGAHANREADGSWTSPYQLARNLCLFTAAAAGAQPIDTVFVNFRDEKGFRVEASTAARDGFTAKMAIHPNQVAAINEIFTPSAEEVGAAEELIKAFADNPRGRRPRHRRADGRPRPHRPRRAHPGAGQGSGRLILAAPILLPQGRIPNERGPGVRSGSARSANSHSSLRVSRGSMISSTQKVSAVRNGERSALSRASISASLALRSGAASISAR